MNGNTLRRYVSSTTSVGIESGTIASTGPLAEPNRNAPTPGQHIQFTPSTVNPYARGIPPQSRQTRASGGSSGTRPFREDGATCVTLN